MNSDLSDTLRIVLLDMARRGQHDVRGRSVVPNIKIDDRYFRDYYDEDIEDALTRTVHDIWIAIGDSPWIKSLYPEALRVLRIALKIT